MLKRASLVHLIGVGVIALTIFLSSYSAAPAAPRLTPTPEPIAAENMGRVTELL